MCDYASYTLLRFDIDERGDLTIYPIANDTVPRKWKRADDLAPGQPSMVPDGASLEPRLIELPIRVRAPSTKTG